MDVDAYDNDFRISPKMGTPSEIGMSLTQAQNPGLESDSAIDAPRDYIPPSAGPTEAARVCFISTRFLVTSPISKSAKCGRIG